MQHQPLPRLQPPFQIPAVKKLARQQATRLVLHQQVIDRVVRELVRNRLPAHHLRANRVDAVRLDIFHVGKVDAIFVAKRQVQQQVFDGVNPALGQQLRALRTDALDHLDVGGQGQR